MTRDDILNMPAGREMDAQIAQSVFGMRLTKNHGLAGGFYWVGNGVQFGIMQERDIFAFSTDIAAAWKVTEKFWSVEVNKYLDGKEWRAYVVRLSNDNKSNSDGGSFADTAPLAICRAALLAVMDGGQ